MDDLKTMSSEIRLEGVMTWWDENMCAALRALKVAHPPPWSSFEGMRITLLHPDST